MRLSRRLACAGECCLANHADRRLEIQVNLHRMLLEREAAGRPVTVGLIGAGKFGTMFLAQARLTRGMHVVAVADLDVERARNQLRSAGWEDEAISAPSLAAAHTTGRTLV